MFPLLLNDPIAAAKMVSTLAQKVSGIAAIASKAQHLASSQHWVEYVARASLGTSQTDPDVADLTRANRVPGTNGPKAHFDGLVDVTFKPSVQRDSLDVELISATLTGVKEETIRKIAETSLLDQPIPIRATAAPTAVSAVTTLTVVRDDKGKVAYSEDVEARRLLELKGGGDRARGATKLLQELVGAALGNTLKSDDTGEK